MILITLSGQLYEQRLICFKRGANYFLMLSDGNPTSPYQRPRARFLFQVHCFRLIAPAYRQQRLFLFRMVEYNAQTCKAWIQP